MHLYIYTHTGAGTIGDNEVEAITAAKWSRTDVIYIHIYTHIKTVTKYIYFSVMPPPTNGWRRWAK